MKNEKLQKILVEMNKNAEIILGTKMIRPEKAITAILKYDAYEPDYLNVEKKYTDRGFGYTEFDDLYGHKCSIQESSIATVEAIWFGVDDAEPKIMASDANNFGVETEETCGWVTYPIPEEVLISTRMHLSKEQVKNLIPVLEHFVQTGEL